MCERLVLIIEFSYSLLHLLNLMLSMAVVSLLLGPLIRVLIITRKTLQILSGGSAALELIQVPHLPQLAVWGFMHHSHVQQLMVRLKHVRLKHFLSFFLNSLLSLRFNFLLYTAN